MRERKRLDRVKPKSNPNPSNLQAHLITEGNKIIDVKPKPILDAVSPSVKREGYGKASSTVIPELDADGQPIPELT